jgi:hypothetical protein
MPSLLDCPIPEQSWLDKANRTNGTCSAPPESVNGLQQEIPDAGPWTETIEKMIEFQHLGDKWDGLNAEAPTPELIASAIGLAYTLHEQGVEPPSSVIAGLDGFLNFEWQLPDGTFCDIEIDRPFHAEVMLIEPGQPAKYWTLPTD